MFVENILKFVEPEAFFQDMIFNYAPFLQIQLLIFMFVFFYIRSSMIGDFSHVFVTFHHIC